VIGTSLQKRVNGALSMMQYTVSPDVTTSSLSISTGESGQNGMYLTQLGGGFTWSNSFRLYLEGNAAYSRYDPRFALTNGTEQRQVQAQWNTLVGTVASVGFPDRAGTRAAADRQLHARPCDERPYCRS